MIHRAHKDGGYSLVETIIYVALFVGLSALLIDSLIVMGKAYTESRASRDVLYSAQASMERIMHEVRGADSVDVSTSQFGVNPSTLVLTGTDEQGAPETVHFSVVNGQIHVAVNGGTAYPLTDTRTSIDSLIFRHIGGGQAEGVRIEMTVHSLRSVSPAYYSIVNTAALRKAQ